MQNPPGPRFGSTGIGFGTPPSASPFGGLPNFPSAEAQRSFTQARYAGFWIRLVAFVIDSVIVWVPQSLVLAAFTNSSGAAAPQSTNPLLAVVSLVLFAATLAYFIYLPSIGGTVGQRICGLRVVNARDDTSNIGLAKSVLRFVGFVISFFVFYVGLIWIAFDAEKQGWQDKIASTHVIRK